MPAMKAPDAGELRERVSIAVCVPSGCPDPCGYSCDRCEHADQTDRWEWRLVRRAYAKAEISNRLAIFSNTGVAGRETTFTLRRQGLTLRNAIFWRDEFYFLTSVEPLGPAHLTVRSAKVRLRYQCRGVQAGTGLEITFPAVAAERYQGHRQEEPMAQNEVSLVLVTPKAIALKLGSLVDLGDGQPPFWVKVAHLLDGDKNEYEITRTIEP